MRISRLFTLLSLSVLCACGQNMAPQGDTRTREQREDYRYGSVLGGEGGLQLFGPSKKADGEQSNIGVNSFLWRASLDTLSFMPLASADPFGGVIITDWYTPPETQDERFKVNVLILDRQLRADGLTISIFRQKHDRSKGWVDVAVSPETVVDLENTILTRAREIRVMQKSN